MRRLIWGNSLGIRRGAGWANEGGRGSEGPYGPRGEGPADPRRLGYQPGDGASAHSARARGCVCVGVRVRK